MSIPLYQVDAFSSQPFKGNPAGVCLLKTPADDAWMQALAAEMNLSETAFLLPEADGYRLRWFTPAVEVELCGHATLASAHVLWQTELLQFQQEARFHTHSGLLTARQIKIDDENWIELNFPAKAPQPAEAPPGLTDSLGVKSVFVGRSQWDYFVEVTDEDTVRNLQPDINRLRQVDARGVIVTSRSTQPGVDFVSRFFAPRVGVNEDPVTGSAHCCLTPFWSARLGKTILLAHQVSARGGVLRVEMAGERVRIAGQAVTVFKAECFA